jgi:hypothetical protein
MASKWQISPFLKIGSRGYFPQTKRVRKVGFQGLFPFPSAGIEKIPCLLANQIIIRKAFGILRHVLFGSQRFRDAPSIPGRESFSGIPKPKLT